MNARYDEVIDAIDRLAVQVCDVRDEINDLNAKLDELLGRELGKD